MAIEDLEGHIKEFLLKLTGHMDDLVGEFWKEEKLKSVTKTPILVEGQDEGGEIVMYFSDNQDLNLKIIIQYFEDGEP